MPDVFGNRRRLDLPNTIEELRHDILGSHESAVRQEERADEGFVWQLYFSECMGREDLPSADTIALNSLVNRSSMLT